MSSVKVKTGIGKPPQGAFVTARQLRFCEEYVVDLNGKRAAIAAGYSKKTAAVTPEKSKAKPSALRIPVA